MIYEPLTCQCAIMNQKQHDTQSHTHTHMYAFISDPAPLSQNPNTLRKTCFIKPANSVPAALGQPRGSLGNEVCWLAVTFAPAAS